MAFKPVTGGNRFASTKKASEMEAGDEIIGHLIAVEKSRGEYEGYNFILSVNGENVLLYGTGTLKYYGMDTLAGSGGKRLMIGANTKITAQGKSKKVNKAGKKYEVSDFTVEQDTDDVIAGDNDAFNAVFDSTENVPASTKTALKNGIAERANALAGVAGGRK
jgi:hypothetical protein